MTKIFFILLGLLAASGLALAATTSRQFSVAGQPSAPPAVALAAAPDPERFIVSGDFPKDQLAKVEADFTAGKIQAPQAIKLPSAYTKELGRRNQAAGVLLTCISPPCPPPPPPPGGGGATAPATFNDQYCPYNLGANGNDPQCGGGPIERIDHTQCTYNPVVSFYENCNYGNNPNVRQHIGTLSPEHPSPSCPTDGTAACACSAVDTPPCGTVLRLFPPGCIGCCPPLPVSCEQCCKGSAWLYDTATQGCSCGVGP